VSRGPVEDLSRGMRLLVFGRFSPRNDPTLQAVVDVARARAHVVHVADIHAFVTGPVRWSPAAGRLVLGDLDIGVDDVDVVLLGPLPSAFARTSPPGTRLTADEHDRLQKIQAGRHQLAWSIVLDLEARGVPVLSLPTMSHPFDHKPLQLAALARAGVRVPETVVADSDVLDGDWLSKPVVGGAVDVDHVVAAVAGVPRLVQRVVQGRQLRVACVGGVVVAAGAVVDVHGSDVVGDWRGRDDVGFVAVEVDEALRALARCVFQVCHFEVCALDVIVADDGLVLLEANRTPQLMDLARDLGVDVAGAVVDLCEARARR